MNLSDAWQRFRRSTFGPSARAFDARLNSIEIILSSALERINHSVLVLADTVNAAAVNSGRQAGGNFISHHAQVYSQNGEDGIIAEIFSRIGTKDKFFVEIGVQDGSECNTRLLLETGWTGVWIEGNPEDAAKAREYFKTFIDQKRLKVIEAFITKENINAIMDEAAIPMSFDFLSVDIDMNTTHVWRELSRNSRVSCIEFNASLPPSVDVEVVYDPLGIWDGSSYFGGSLKTVENIGNSKGQKLLTCDELGVNAFLAAETELRDAFSGPFSAQALYVRPRYEAVRHSGHRASKVTRHWNVRS